jgi:hypothetical protein
MPRWSIIYSAMGGGGHLLSEHPSASYLVTSLPSAWQLIEVRATILGAASQPLGNLTHPVSTTTTASTLLPSTAGEFPVSVAGSFSTSFDSLEHGISKQIPCSARENL